MLIGRPHRPRHAGPPVIGPATPAAPRRAAGHRPGHTGRAVPARPKAALWMYPYRPGA